MSRNGWRSPAKGEAWSFSDLRREHGEDVALAMLADMKGYGQFRWERSEGLSVPKMGTKNGLGCPICGGNMTESPRGCWQ